MLLPQFVIAKECVVLLHGLGRSSKSFLIMEWRLQRSGYEVVSIDYPSRKQGVDRLAKIVLDEGFSKCSKGSRVNFITHSLGGILLRYALSKRDDLPVNMGRVVMLAPPNHGSEVVDKLMNFPGFKEINGPTGLGLGTGDNSIPNQLGPVRFDLGVIAGTESINPFFSTMIDGQDDGAVSVESTKVEGMRDHIKLPVTHSFLMNDTKVFSEAGHFLKNGRFKKAP